MKLTNKLGYPPAYIAAAEKYIYELKPDRIGVTQLISSPMIRRLQLERWDDLVIDVEDLFTQMVGSAWHKWLEPYVPKGYKSEEKWEVSVSNSSKLVLVGKADLCNGGIEDYKLMSGWSYVFDAEKHFTEQLNIYRWLQWQKTGKQANYLKIHCFIKDWSEYQARNPDYPQSKYICRDLVMWPLDATAKYIKERLILHRDKNYQCNDEDKWCRTEKWAVMQKGRKSALRLLDAFAGAEQWILENNLTTDFASGKVYIEERKSECRNCLSYCPARSVCDFAKNLRS